MARNLPPFAHWLDTRLAYSTGETDWLLPEGRDLLRRKAAAAPLDLPRNSGKRRTASKKTLLKAIEEAGGKW